MSTLRRVTRALAWTFMYAGLATCGDGPLAPGSAGPVHVTLAPAFTRAARNAAGDLSTFSLDINNIRIQIARPSAKDLVDTTIAVPSGADSVLVNLTLAGVSAGDALDASMQFRQDQQILFEGTGTLTARAPGAPPASAAIPQQYVGPGASVAHLAIAPRDTSLSGSTTLAYRYQTTDSANGAVANAQVLWASSDTSLGTINLTTGVLTTTGKSGTLTINARTLGQVRDSTHLTINGASALALTTAPATAVSGAAFQTQPVVEVHGPSGQVVPTATNAVTAAITTGTGTLLGTATVAAVSGVAHFTNLRIDNAGTYTLTFSSPGLTAVTSQVTVAVGAAAIVAASAGNSQSAVAGSAVTTPPAVTVTDAAGNPVSGVAVTFAVQSGGGQVTGASQTTSATGVATVGSWTLGTAAGPDSLSATAAGLTGSPVLFAATGTVGGPAKLAVATAPPASVRDRIIFATQPAVQLQDANGNAVSQSGVAVTASVTSGGGALAGTVTATTNAAGRATFSNLSLSGTAGAKMLTFSATGATSVTAPTALTAGLSSAVIVAAGNHRTANVVAPVDTAPAVKVIDADSNGVAGVQVSFAVTTGGGQLVGSTATTSASGIAALGSWTLGTASGLNTVSATVVDTTTGGVGFIGGTGGTLGVRSIAGSPVTFSAVATPLVAAGVSMATAPSTSVRDRQFFPVQPVAIVHDTYNNGLPGMVVTASITSGGGTLAGVTTATTNATGVATFSNLSISGTVGARTLTFTTTNGSTGTATTTLTAGSPATIAASTSTSQTALLGTAVSQAPAVKVTDADGNAVAGDTVVFAVTGGDGTVSGAPTVVTNSSGVASVTSWTLGTSSWSNGTFSGDNAVTATASNPSAGGIGIVGGTGGTFGTAAIAGNPVIFNATGTLPTACSSPISYTLGNSASGTLGSSSCVRNITGSIAPLDQYTFTTTGQTFFQTTLASTAFTLRQTEFLWGSNPFTGSPPLYSGTNGWRYDGSFTTTHTETFIVAAGTYTIEATSPNAGAAGAYTFSSTVNPSVPTGCLFAVVTRNITVNHTLDTGCNYTKNGGTGSTASKIYDIFIPTGTVVTITMTSNAVIPSLELYRITGTSTTFVTSDANTSAGTQAQIVFTGTGNLMRIRTTTTGSTVTTGAYTLTISP